MFVRSGVGGVEGRREQDARYSSFLDLTLLHSERPKLHTLLAFLSAIGLKVK